MTPAEFIRAYLVGGAAAGFVISVICTVLTVYITRYRNSRYLQNVQWAIGAAMRKLGIFNAFVLGSIAFYFLLRFKYGPPPAHVIYDALYFGLVAIYTLIIVALTIPAAVGVLIIYQITRELKRQERQEADEKGEGRGQKAH